MLSSDRSKLAAFAAAGLSTTLILLGAARTIPAGADVPIAVLHRFPSGFENDGPDSKLTLGPDGDYYGTTRSGGANNDGTIYKIDPSGVYTVVHDFTGTDGAGSESPVTFGRNGVLYGTTVGGGRYNLGTLYRLEPNGVETVLHDFAGGADGAQPYAGLMYADDVDTLYGTTVGLGSSGAAEYGTIFSYNTGEFGRADAYSVQYRFGEHNGPTDGETPYGTLILAAVRGQLGQYPTLYGTTHAGGPGGQGTAFVFFPGYAAGTLSVLHAFNDGSVKNDVYGPSLGPLQQDAAGNLYGTTESGGGSNVGELYKIAPDFSTSILHSFKRDSGGLAPEGGVLLARDGNLYGVTLATADGDDGVVYKIAPSGSGFDAIYTFDYSNPANAFEPFNRPVEDADGNLFGTTIGGGGSAGVTGNGTIYKLAANIPDTITQSVDLVPQKVTGNTTRVTGTVTLDTPAPVAGAVVHLTSDTPGAACLQDSITIPSGQITGTFNIQTFPVATSTPVKISTNYDGSTASSELTVTPQPAVPSLSALQLSPAARFGSMDSDLDFAYLDAPAAADTTVTLTSSNPDVAQVDKTVVVHKGATRYFFHVKTATAMSAQTVTITGTLNGVSKSAALTVLPTPPALSAVLAFLPSVKGGTASTANEVRLYVSAAADTLVFLTSSNPSVASVPASVLVHRRTRASGFTITTSAVSTARSVTITARSGGVTKTRHLTVEP